ncbi:MAG TPA: hypothetical protein VHE54_01200 [Puia sp.]|nr:hypothetical protein [Puia sp.]
MPFDCDKLLHPFQNDPGTSQKARVMDALLGGPALIDGRSMADLLQLFTRLAPNIVYYDDRLTPGDWTPFFQKSCPFLLAGMTHFTTATIDSKLALYAHLFRKKPSGAGLQLQLFYTYYNLIRQVNTWSSQLAGSHLPIETTINKLIVTRLKQPVLQFIGIVNAAVKWYGVKKPDFGPLINNPAWGLDQTDLYALDTAFKKAGPGHRKRLLALHREAADLVPAFAGALGILAGEAPGNIEQSLLPLATSLQQRHQPHLALIFVFLQLFVRLQQDINGFKKAHLDFFYSDILRLEPQPAQPDHANLIVYLQNQVKSFALEKGRPIKDGKDNNKADILFALDEAIAVNLTQASDIRTLFCNNQTAYDKTWTEGVYMAPDARMADGVSISFTHDPTNYPTLGAQYSKYVPPRATNPQPYPGARIGFLLASNVLFLHEGTRHVHIRLTCTLQDDACGAMAAAQAPPPDRCCVDRKKTPAGGPAEVYPDFVSATNLYPSVAKVLKHAYVEITETLIAQAVQQGVATAVGDAIRDKFLKDDCQKSLCCKSHVYYKDSTVRRWNNWQAFIGAHASASEVTVLDGLFGKIYPFTVVFSGAKEWIAPATLDIDPDAAPGGGGTFDIRIHAQLTPDQPAVTFYDKKALGEDFNTTLPVVKVLLNDKIKVALDNALQGTLGIVAADACCLDRTPDLCGAEISLYQLFRNVTLNDTHIRVKVCGLRNIIVQNDNSLQNVNSPIFPFGTRPKVEANFYIGCEEIFLKHWEHIYVNINWKDFPADPPAGAGFTTPFNYYYNGYQDHFPSGDLFEVKDDYFRKKIAILQDGKWIPWQYGDCTTPMGPHPAHSLLFHPMPAHPFCPDDAGYGWQYRISRANDFVPALPDPSEVFGYLGLKHLDVNTRQSFIRITLKCQDFQHDRYPGVLARQMSALGKLPDLIDGAVYYGINAAGQYQVVDINSLFADVVYASQLANDNTLNPIPMGGAGGQIDIMTNEFAAADVAGGGGPMAGVGQPITNALLGSFDTPVNIPPPPPAGPSGVYPTLGPALQDIFTKLKNQATAIEGTLAKGAVIPNQPWTPTISSMSLDYEATSDATQLSLIHLYPYTGTYLPRQITLDPPLFPVFCDEGTLFLGLSGLVPGSIVNFLFQLAEATADSESDQARVAYSYLDDNEWMPLRPGFEVISDGTEGLTRTGIIKLSLPANMTNTNTVMPAGVYWIKAAVPQHHRSVAETIALLTQAISATFINDPNVNEQTRMSTPLAAGSLSRLATADAHIKSIGQPYPSYGGAPPEAQGPFYVRVSELLHHKGRAIQKFDYERLVLQRFPVIFKAKCINHSLALDGSEYKNDFPLAPGYVLLAVIPDLNQLAAGNSFQPKVPVSILEDIYTYISGLTSPFVRFRAMNPRYEAIDFCMTVRLKPDMDANYYKQQLAIDLSRFLAPWAVGQYDKLTFGQPVYRSDIVGFLESRYYVDYVIRLEMFNDKGKAHHVIFPATPRSILIAGTVEVCAFMPGCDEWGEPACKEERYPVRDCKQKVLATEGDV